jgi:hypothetical protein
VAHLRQYPGIFLTVLRKTQRTSTRLADLQTGTWMWYFPKPRRLGTYFQSTFAPVMVPRKTLLLETNSFLEDLTDSRLIWKYSALMDNNVAYSCCQEAAFGPYTLINSVHNFTQYYFNIDFNITLASIPTSQSSVSFKSFQLKSCMKFSVPPCRPYVPF